MRTTRTVALAVLTLASAPTPGLGQWRVGLGLGTESYRGVSRETAGDLRYFGPGATTVWEGRVERTGRRVAWGFALRYATPGLALQGPELTVLSRQDNFEVAGAEPALRVTLARLTDGVRLQAGLGALLERWALPGDESRYRAGVHLGPTLDIGLGGRVTGLVEARLGYTPRSPVAGALPEELEARAMWRRSLRGALLLRP